MKHTNYNTTVMKLRGGNIQVATSPAGTVVMPKNLYLLNGKELQNEMGLNMYAMDMRQYDPAIGRWIVVDPVTHHWQSPYSSFNGNPIFFADPSGAEGEPINTWHYAGGNQMFTGAGNLSAGDHMFGGSGDEFWNSQTAYTGGELAWSNYYSDIRRSTISVGGLTQVAGDPPNSFMEFLQNLFRMPKSEEQAEESHFWNDVFEGSIKIIDDVGSKFQTAMMLAFPTPGGAAGESKALYTVVRESSTKYSVLINKGSASAFYKTLNPGWTGKLYEVQGTAFAQTSFKTANGTLVKLTNTSSSTGQATVKIIGNNIQYLFRFPIY